MVKKQCSICNKSFLVKPYRIKKAKYCSYKCYWRSKKGQIVYSQKGKNLWPNGRIFSKEHRDKITQSLKGRKPTNWKGGKIINKGYICIYKPNHPFSTSHGYIREHRLVMEKYLNRYLKPSEHCHHINRIKLDNRIQNLMIFNSNSAHKRFEKNRTIKPSEIIFDGRRI